MLIYKSVAKMLQSHESKWNKNEIKLKRHSQLVSLLYENFFVVILAGLLKDKECNGVMIITIISQKLFVIIILICGVLIFHRNPLINYNDTILIRPSLIHEQNFTTYLQRYTKLKCVQKCFDHHYLVMRKLVMYVELINKRYFSNIS